MPKYQLEQLIRNSKEWEVVQTVKVDSRRQTVYHFFQNKLIPGHMRIRLEKQ